MKTVDYILPCYLVAFMFGMDDIDITTEQKEEIQLFCDTNNLGNCVKITENSFEYIDDLYKVEQECYTYTFQIKK